jgi:hypothetical protein
MIGMLAAASGAISRAMAQEFSSGVIRGSVRGLDSTGLDGGLVRAVNTATGFSTRVEIRRGSYLIQGLELGGPYVVEASRIGYRMQRSEPVVLRLGQPVHVNFALEPITTELQSVQVSAARPGIGAGGGTATVIGQSFVRNLPSQNRNFYDFVALAPQVSTKIGFGRSGVSAAGGNLRFNNYTINGADERFVGGSVSAANNVGKSIPLDAVKEYQVLVAPYDVRFGDFAGGLVNTVTESGTNEFRGTTFTYWRNDKLRRQGGIANPYDRLQYGFLASGPIVRNRVHFLIAPELQQLSEPAAGPCAGQSAPLSVGEADLLRLDRIMESKYGLMGGSAACVTNNTPMTNVFARLDGAIPELRSRVTAFVTHASRNEEDFSRSATGETLEMSTIRYSSEVGLRLMSIQLRTDFAHSGGHNELLVSSSKDWSDLIPEVRQPLVRVRIPGTTGGSVVVSTGTAETAQGRFGRANALKLSDEFSLPLGPRHTLVLGGKAERFNIRRGGIAGSYGIWTFPSLDALEAGTAEDFDLKKDFGSASTPLSGVQSGAYVEDQVFLGDHFTVTMGVRGDRLDLSQRAPYNPVIDSIFGRRTDRMPRAKTYFSPRLGFSWDPSRAGLNQLRGGVGVFTGRPPLAWLVPAVADYGVRVGSLSCGFLPGDRGPPPAFVSDYRNPPQQCASGPGLQAAPYGDVDLVDQNLRLAQSLRGSLAYVRRLPFELTATLEAVATRYISDFMFVNLNLPPARGADRFGRVMYGIINSNGVADSVARSPFSQVIDLTNTSKNYSNQVSLRLERQTTRGIGGSLSYTYSRTRDVQSPSRVNQRGILMWGDARAVSGRHDDLVPGISLNDLPHRVVAAATWTAPWNRWSTDFAMYYVGESGSPFTYIATGTDARRGDLNADGSNANDPIYVPRSALDSHEIIFSAIDTTSSLGQAQAFEKFIERSSCLRRQRGRIVERNSCREPWSHTTTASVRQAIPVGKRSLEAELSIFNVLNLLHSSWGQYRVALPGILQHVGQSGSGQSSQPVFRFDATRPQWDKLSTESAFQAQFGLRYRF